MSDSALIRAPAKVNLFLRVLRRREDGFHELETLFQAIDLCDVVHVSLTDEGVQLEVHGPEPCPVEENLAYRAAQGFLRVVPLKRGVRVRLEKHIPAGAGLGGGSSDAAAVLRCLAALSGAEAGAPALLKLAAELGSDVPFFFGTAALALGRGRGELLEPVPPLPPRWLVVALPPVHISTAAAYQSLGRPSDYSRTSPTPAAEATSWEALLGQSENDFQDSVASAHPRVAESLAALVRAGGKGVSLSGSGAAAYGVFDSGPEAEAAAQRLEVGLGWSFHAVETLAELPEPQLR